MFPLLPVLFFHLSTSSSPNKNYSIFALNLVTFRTCYFSRANKRSVVRKEIVFLASGDTLVLISCKVFFSCYSVRQHRLRESGLSVTGKWLQILRIVVAAVKNGYQSKVWTLWLKTITPPPSYYPTRHTHPTYRTKATTQLELFLLRMKHVMDLVGCSSELDNFSST